MKADYEPTPSQHHGSSLLDTLPSFPNCFDEDINFDEIGADFSIPPGARNIDEIDLYCYEKLDPPSEPEENAENAFSNEMDDIDDFHGLHSSSSLIMSGPVQANRLVFEPILDEHTLEFNRRRQGDVEKHIRSAKQFTELVPFLEWMRNEMGHDYFREYLAFIEILRAFQHYM